MSVSQEKGQGPPGSFFVMGHAVIWPLTWICDCNHSVICKVYIDVGGIKCAAT